MRFSRIVLSIRTILVETRLYMQLLTIKIGHGSNNQSVEAISLVASSIVYVGVLLVGLGVVCGFKAITFTINVFATEGPPLRNILATEGKTTFFHCLLSLYGLLFTINIKYRLMRIGVYQRVTAFSGVRTGPPERTYTHAFNRHNPQSTDNIFALVGITHVDTLSVKNAHLIVNQRPVVAIRKEVALYLQADITSVTGRFASSVAKSR